jgi:hypothetical protein
VVRFTQRPLYPGESALRYPLDRRFGGHQGLSGRRGEENILDPVDQPVASRYTDWAIHVDHASSRLLDNCTETNRQLFLPVINRNVKWPSLPVHYV